MLGHERSRFGEARFSEAWVAERGWIKGLGAVERLVGVGRISAARQGVARHGAVERAGVEIGKAVMRGDALGDGALAGRRGPVDGDDHRNWAPFPWPIFPQKSANKFVHVAIYARSCCQDFFHVATTANSAAAISSVSSALGNRCP